MSDIDIEADGGGKTFRRQMVHLGCGSLRRILVPHPGAAVGPLRMFRLPKNIGWFFLVYRRFLLAISSC
jgi:hypothetical protein